MNKRPEKEADPQHYPGQIINRPSHFEQPLVRALEEWDGDCVLGYCKSPSGCELDNQCRENGTT